MSEAWGPGGRRVTLGLLAAAVVLMVGVASASVSTDAPGAGGPDRADRSEELTLGAAAGEADRPVSRWWFTPWSAEARTGEASAAGAVADLEVEVPAADSSRGTVDGEVGAEPFVDQDDLWVDSSDIVAMRTPEGFDVAAGRAEFGGGPTVTYTVELDPAVGEDLLAFTAAVEEALGDPRSWARDRRFVRVDDPAKASVRVVLATPGTVDRLCGEVGLQTVGLYSCWTGRFAALNSWRWAEGASAFEDLTTYRRYLVNHEVGHALGFGHVGCPAEGALAPVMMQQSISTGACVANGWPYP